MLRSGPILGSSVLFLKSKVEVTVEKLITDSQDSVFTS